MRLKIKYTLSFAMLMLLAPGIKAQKSTNPEPAPVPPFTQKICLVTVDTAISKNVVVWEKTPGHAIRYFKIYKENHLTQTYDSIGFRPWDSLSYFVDMQSFPAVGFSKYRISYVDSNGVESALSPLHQTIQLTITKTTGWNFDLTWTPYIGFPVYYYRIWRWSPGNGWNKIDSVTGGNFYYNDSPPVGLVYYYVETVSPFPCHVTKAQTNYNTSRSNRANTSILSGMAGRPQVPTVDVVPNPFHNQAVITCVLPAETTLSIDLYAPDGRFVKTVTRHATARGSYQTAISGDGLSGLYFLRIKTGETTTIRKIMIIP